MNSLEMFEPTIEQINILSRTILDEIVKSAGIAQTTFRQWVVRNVLNPPARRFAYVAARFDHITQLYNFQQAASDLLSRFVDDIQISGLENIPMEGPLLIAANHPGTYDALSVISSLPRKDLKVVISGVPFTEELQAARRHFIYSPPMDQTYGRMHTLRSSVRHLREGGALLLFPTGHVDPDPAQLPGAEQALERWSRSLEVILRKVPDTQVVLTIISGVVTQRSVKHPITRLLRNIEAYKTAQIVQIAGQMFLPHKNRPIPQISFGSPFIAQQIFDYLSDYRSFFQNDPSLTIMQNLIEQAKQLLVEHLEEFGITSYRPEPELAAQP